jgi:hypothetical protein
VLAELELNPYGEGEPNSLRGRVVLDCGAHLGAFTRQEGILNLHTSNGTADDCILGPDTGSSERISVTTVDHLVSALHLGSVDLIKMDIEGAGPQALSGASETLKKYKPQLAIASYHTINEYRGISEAVLKANSSYRSTHTACRVDLGYSVPLTLMFK